MAFKDILKAIANFFKKVAKYLEEQRFKNLQKKEIELKRKADRMEKEKPYKESIAKSMKRIERATPKEIRHTTNKPKEEKDYYKVDLGMDDFKL